ncbi:MAG: hypothetical protein ACI4MS_02000 [Candidatus Coproplasma sp.]
MNLSTVIVRVVLANQQKKQKKDRTKIALTVAELCIGTNTGNAQIAVKKFIPMRMTMTA